MGRPRRGPAYGLAAMTDPREATSRAGRAARVLRTEPLLVAVCLPPAVAILAWFLAFAPGRVPHFPASPKQIIETGLLATVVSIFTTAMGSAFLGRRSWPPALLCLAAVILWTVVLVGVFGGWV